MRGAVLAVAAAAVLPVACGSGGIAAPTERGVCWHMVRQGEEPPRFNRLGTGVTSIEQCAGALEAMRLRFGGMGLARTEVSGAYQGQFLFLRPSGVWVTPRLESRGYLALVRTGDGRLATVGAVRQPTAP